MTRHTLIFGFALIVLYSCHSGPDKTHENPAAQTDETSGSLKVDVAECQHYQKFTAKEIQFDYPGFSPISAYQHQGLTLLLGSYDQEPKDLPNNDYGGFRLLVMNAKGELIFRSRGAADSRSFSPTFYRLDEDAPVFMLIETGDEGGSWCNSVFSIKGNKVKELGTIDLSLPKKEVGEYVNVAEVTQICKSGSSFQFDFLTDSVTLDHNGQNEKNLDASQWHYVLVDEKLKLLKK